MPFESSFFECFCFLFFASIIFVHHLCDVSPFQVKVSYNYNTMVCYPYVAFHAVSFITVLLVCTILPAIVVFVLSNRKNDWCFWRASFWVNFACIVSPFLFGMTVTFLLTKMFKFLAERFVHPDCSIGFKFYDDEDGSTVNATYLMPVNEHDGKNLSTYAEYMNVLNEHASDTTFSLVFISMILQNAPFLKNYKTIAVFCQGILLLLVLLVAVSRIADFNNEWYSSLVDLFVGTLTAVLTYTVINKSRQVNDLFSI